MNNSSSQKQNFINSNSNNQPQITLPRQSAEDVWREQLLINPSCPQIQPQPKKSRVVDPSNRFLRREKLKEESHIVTFRSLDQEEGTEVLWHEVNLANADKDQIQKLCTDIKILGHLNAPHIINLHHAWLDKTRKLLVLITELFSEQTIRSYVKDVLHNPSRTVIGNWCIHILDGLEHLHSQLPPLIHNNIRCDNIFIDSSEGLVKLGLFNIDNYLGDPYPPLSAPETQKNILDPKSDVWDLGLAVIEMATGQQPYSEFSTPESLRTAIKEQRLPQAFSEISDTIVADFVNTCLLPFEQRPSTFQLIEHSLIVELLPDGDNSYRCSDMSPRQSTKEISDDLAAALEQGQKEIMSKLKESPEFIDLLKRQFAEKNKLKETHAAQRKFMIQKIRERIRNKKNINADLIDFHS